MDSTKNKERNDLLKSIGFSYTFIEKLESYDSTVYESPIKEIEKLNEVVDTINESHDLLISEKTYLPSYQIKIGDNK